VSDGFAVQTNVVRQDGRRGVLLSILKNGNASTLDVVKGVRGLLPRVLSTVSPGLRLIALADQSVFVRAAIVGVIREGVIATALTALMILLFLGSWRSTLIIGVSIPLSILTSIIVLSLMGETINTMTLGGLALAVGILVDDATVTIENIERYLEEGQPPRHAILQGAAQISVPALGVHRRSDLTGCGCLLYASAGNRRSLGMAGRDYVFDATLLRFFGVLRYGGRDCTDVLYPFPAQLQLAIQSDRHHRLLAALAYDADSLHHGLRLRSDPVSRKS
jgi:hypothetical protein